MAQSFADLVAEKGSVSAALASQGYSKGDSGSWSKDGGSSSGSSSKSNTGSSYESSSGSSSDGSSSASSGIYGVPVIDKAKNQGSAAIRNLPDLSRQPGLANGYAISGGYTNFYDENGYLNGSYKGKADYTPYLDTTGQTDGNILTGADQARIQALREQAQAGQISWDDANKQANAIRSGYGYTMDKSGNVTDLGALSRVDQRRQAWGLPTNGVSEEQQNYLTLMGQGSSAAGSYVPGTGMGSGIGQDAASQYLRDLYDQQTAANLAALKSTYEQNVADVKANDDLISAAYAKQKNQTAAQNDLQRMQMNEYGLTHGLNTGTSGQMALAQNVAYQGNLAQLGAQEAQSLADNALNLEKLTAAYRNAIDQAQAEGNYQLASALYEEYVRQENLAWQQQQAAQEQANWQAQFDASQQQYQDSLSASTRDNAYNLAMTMLQNGVMPDADTLAAAGIPTSMAQSYQQQAARQIAAELAYQKALTASKYSGGSGGSSSGSSGGSSGASNTPKSSGVSITNRSGVTASPLDYNTIVTNSEAGNYGPKYGLVLGEVQAKFANGADSASIADVISRALNSGDINEAGAETIMQALGY